MRVNDRRVVAVKEAADRRPRYLRHLVTEVHGDLARIGDVVAALRGADVLARHFEMRADDALDHLHRDAAPLLPAQIVAERGDAGRLVDRHTHHGGVFDEAREGALELADVAVHAARDIGHHIGGDIDILALCLFLEDRDARLELRRLDIDGRTAREARDQTILEPLDILRLAIRGQDDLAAVVAQLVERLEKFRLRLLLPREELNIVDQQHVDMVVFLAECVHILLADGADKFIGKVRARDIENALFRIVGEDLVADRVHEMRLAEPHAAVDEERVVRGEPRRVCNGLCHGVGELVRATRDERLEGILRVERRRVVRCRRVRLGRRERKTALRGVCRLLVRGDMPGGCLLCHGGFHRDFLRRRRLFLGCCRRINNDPERIAGTERLLYDITEQCTQT